jgi:hypothetical protein
MSSHHLLGLLGETGGFHIALKLGHVPLGGSLGGVIGTADKDKCGAGE